MSIIRQGSLFDIQDLYELEPTHRFDAIFSTLNINPILMVVSKKSLYGAPTELNYAAMIYALVARIIERIPTIKDLRKRLKHDFIFRLECGFLFSDRLPSEASFSRLIQKISESKVLETVKEQLIIQAITEGFIQDDATHFESRDKAKAQEKKPKPEPKKRGRKSKSEKEAYEKLKQEEEAQKNVFEKSIAAQLDVTFEDLRSEIPIDPAWGIKKNSEGKNVFWYGFKVSPYSNNAYKTAASPGTIKVPI